MVAGSRLVGSSGVAWVLKLSGSILGSERGILGSILRSILGSKLRVLGSILGGERLGSECLRSILGSILNGRVLGLRSI